MLTQTRFFVRSAFEKDRQNLANLIHFEPLVHRHLDWRPPLEWIGYHPYLIAEQDEDLVTALACPPDPPGIAWIRLFAVASNVDLQESWNALWSAACDIFREQRDITVAAMPLQGWFRKVLMGSDFSLANQVVMLRWEHHRLPPERKTSSVSIRSMNRDDLPAVTEVDNLAFRPLWRNSQASLESAFKQAAVATIAEIGSTIVGYQLSTANHLGGHLARLAVHTQFQGLGIGYHLLRDVLIQFDKRGARQVTVNTQIDNATSLALYEKAGFQRTGESYPIYQYRV
jgi:ribosomal-protein-alanine N-acetyltransferase